MNASAADPSAPASLSYALDQLVQNPDAVTTEDLRRIVVEVQRHLLVRLRIPSHDAEEAAAAALSRFVVAAQEGRVNRQQGMGYLMRIARNEAVDVLRSGYRRRESLAGGVTLETHPHAEHPSDDNVARSFSDHTNAAAIRSAFATAVAKKDATAVRVVTYVLDRIYETGTPPSNRHVGDALGVSHTGVAKALSRFRAYLVEGEGR